MALQRLSKQQSLTLIIASRLDSMVHENYIDFHLDSCTNTLMQSSGLGAKRLEKHTRLVCHLNDLMLSYVRVATPYYNRFIMPSTSQSSAILETLSSCKVCPQILLQQRIMPCFTVTVRVVKVPAGNNCDLILIHCEGVVFLI